MMGKVAGVASLVVPGLGQALRGRFGDAALFCWAAVWVHTLVLGMLSASLPPDTPVGGVWALGAFGAPRGFALPAAVVFTAVGLALHIAAAWDATRPRASNTTGEEGTWPTSPVVSTVRDVRSDQI